MSEKMLIRSSDSVFLNSKCVFVEYIDIIKSPYFLLMYAIMSAKKELLKKPFDATTIRNLHNIEDLAVWYYSRKNQNPLLDLVSDEDASTISFDVAAEFLDKQLLENEVIFKSSTPLNFADVIKKLMVDSILVQKVYIWYPYDNPIVKADINTTFDNKDIQFVYGDLSRCLKDIPNDSTFVFSDMTNIIVLDELGKLDMSSILVPIDFRYNFNDEEKPLIDIEGLQEDHTFKFDYFVATSR